MKKFESLTVEISYRIESGRSEPSWKALRARVRQEAADGYAYGVDLFPPSSSDFHALVGRILVKVGKTTREVVIDGSKVGQEVAVYRDMRFLGFRSDAA
jgi:hypothetical protein